MFLLFLREWHNYKREKCKLRTVEIENYEKIKEKYKKFLQKDNKCN